MALYHFLPKLSSRTIPPTLEGFALYEKINPNIEIVTKLKKHLGYTFLDHKREFVHICTYIGI